jgi:hypothetical protein
MTAQILVRASLLVTFTALAGSACHAEEASLEQAPEANGVFALPTPLGSTPSKEASPPRGSGFDVRPDLPPPPPSEAPPPAPSPSPAPDASAGTSVDADFARALSAAWTLECEASRIMKNWAGGVPGEGRDCEADERPWIVSLSGEAAFTQDVVALPSGEMWAFQGPVPTRAVANVFPGRSLGPDACEAQGTSGGIYVTSNKSGYCGGTGPTCSPRAGSTFGVAMAFRRTRLADGATLYWMARSISEAAPSDPSAVPFWNYGTCGGMPSGTTSTNRRCRLYRVERP